MTRLAILLLLIGLCHGQDAEVGCYVEGECLGAGFEDFQPLATAAECHELCINTDGCLFFTHYGDETDDFGCFAYRNCPEFSDAGCNDCISGEVDCAVRGTCEISGRCQGVEVDFITEVVTPEECAAACYCNSDCQWWSHDIEFDNCILTADCVGIDSGCDTCVSGATGCDVTGDECEAACPPPPNNVVISGTMDCNTPFSGDTTGEPFISNPAFCETTELGDSPTLWIEFRDQETDFSSVSFDTCTTTFDTEVAVFQDINCNGVLECIDGDDDSCSGNAGSVVNVNVATENAYFVVVTGFNSGEFGTFTLTATCT